MVNYESQLNRVYGALVSPVRRSILDRLGECNGASVSELASPLSMKLPAIMKHLDVLEAAHLITRAKSGRTMYIKLAADPLADATQWLRRYEHFWSNSLDRLVTYAEKKQARSRKGRA